MRVLQLTVLAATAHTAYTFHVPSWLPFTHSKQAPLGSSTDTGSTGVETTVPSPESVHRIAVIGAGAGGSSAAFWIAKAKERFEKLGEVEVDIFEKSDKIGGRSTTVYPYDDPSYEPVELGASIFVKANKNLWRATEEFGLERRDFDDDDDSVGIWDGEKFLLTTSGGRFGGWWDTLKVIWRYGWQAPTKTQSIVDKVVNKFLSLYSWEYSSPFSNLTELVTELGWKKLVSQTTSEYFDLQGINRQWTREMVEAATRVNYGQDVDRIHALEGLCSLAANGVSSVEGGNWRLFEEFVKRSNASVHLNTTVTSISRDKSGTLWTLQTKSSTGVVSIRHYRAIILAAPFHQANINLSPSSSSKEPLVLIPEQSYVNLHVTLLSTPNQPDPAYFGLKEGEKVPSMVLTSYETARYGGKEPEFNSLSYHGKVRRKEQDEAVEEEEYVVKIFSKQDVEDAWLKDVFGEVGWVHRRLFQAYPVLPPTTTFPPLRLGRGLYYVNAFEPLISTMETETISSRNAVELLLHDLYDASICPYDEDPDDSQDAEVGAEGQERRTKRKMKEGEKSTDEKKDFIYGWDCTV